MRRLKPEFRDEWPPACWKWAWNQLSYNQKGDLVRPLQKWKAEDLIAYHKVKIKECPCCSDK